MADPAIRLVLADVDGTLVTQDKVLTDGAIAAVAKLNEAGILFAVTSGRPPRGHGHARSIRSTSQTPIAAFNGGLLVDRDMTVIEQRVVPEHLVSPISTCSGAHRAECLALPGGRLVRPRPQGTPRGPGGMDGQVRPDVMDELRRTHSDVAKIVGVSDDHDAVAKPQPPPTSASGTTCRPPRSQPYYLDVTHPDANKGAVAKYLASGTRSRPSEIATIGDMPNDVLMFAHSGLSIAMGNASAEVQRAARRVTTTNEEEGFADAVERFVLPET